MNRREKTLGLAEKRPKLAGETEPAG